jgi:hypothetical protein
MLIIKIFGSSKVSPLPPAFTPQAAVCFTELLEQEDFSSRNLARAILTRCLICADDGVEKQHVSTLI